MDDTENISSRAALIRGLGKLAEDASDREILDRVAELREQAAEEGEALPNLSEAELLARGEHEAVATDAAGAIVTLYYPIKSGTEELTELRLKRPNARQIQKMQAVKGPPLAHGLQLISDISGRAVAELEKLDAADITLCCAVANFLQQPPRRTGRRS